MPGFKGIVCNFYTVGRMDIIYWLFIGVSQPMRQRIIFPFQLIADKAFRGNRVYLTSGGRIGPYHSADSTQCLNVVPSESYASVNRKSPSLSIFTISGPDVISSLFQH